MLQDGGKFGEHVVFGLEEFSGDLLSLPSFATPAAVIQIEHLH